MKISEDKLDLMLYIISFVQNDKQQFQSFVNSMFGKEYSIEEIKEIMNDLRQKVLVEKYNGEW